MIRMNGFFSVAENTTFYLKITLTIEIIAQIYLKEAIATKFLELILTLEVIVYTIQNINDKIDFFLLIENFEDTAYV